MTKVFIPNRSGHDYSPAEKFGELVYVTEGHVRKSNVNQIYRQFARAMTGAGPNDYFILTSLGVLNAVGAAVLGRKTGRLNLLLFYDGKYIEKRLDLDALLTETLEEEDTIKDGPA